MVPVCQCRNDHALEIAQDVVERFALFGRGGRKGAPHVAGRYTRQDGIPIGAGEVLGDPVDEAVAVAAEFVGVHASGADSIRTSKTTKATFVAFVVED